MEWPWIIASWFIHLQCRHFTCIKWDREMAMNVEGKVRSRFEALIPAQDGRADENHENTSRQI
jgi:hypothetical protein